jgi:hypothetical protein
MPDGSEKFEEEPEGGLVQPEPSITREMFLEWRSPRSGSTNPESMTNPVWDWLIKSKLSAYQANEHFSGPSAMEAGPGWCFDRFGQSSTQLQDGSCVLIAGEHEDHYDPDFYIYNDVVVKKPGGRIEIFCYPREAFPPTDFHSATLVGNRIIIVGNLGYSEQRKPGTTPVLVLDVESLIISAVETRGTSPGWLHRHNARLSEDGKSILVQCGLLDRGEPDKSLVENIDEWKLHVADWRWERLTERRWLRWDVLRSDGQRNHLWEIQQAVWSRSARWDKELRAQMEQLETELGKRPDLDSVEKLFRPPISHESIPQAEDQYNVFRIRAGGVVIRYVVEIHSIQLTVEGDLDEASVNVISADLVRKISALENAEFVLTPI